MRYAVIYQEDMYVKNVIIWDGSSQWIPPSGHFIIQTSIGDIGDLYDSQSGEFTKPLTE
jgi:hypothetical protein